MSAKGESCLENRIKIDLEPRDHPERAGVAVGQQGEVGLERIGARGEAEGEAIGEHEAVKWHRAGDTYCQGRSEAQKARLVNRIGRMEIEPAREGEAVADFFFAVAIEKAGGAIGDIGEGRELGGAGVDHRPFQQALAGEGFDSGEAGFGGHGGGRVGGAGEGQGGVDDNIFHRADAFDDAGIGLGVFPLQARGGIIDVQVDHGGPGAGAGNTFGDQRIRGDGHEGLARLRPRSVEGAFKEGDGHGETPLLKESLWPRKGQVGCALAGRWVGLERRPRGYTGGAR